MHDIDPKIIYLDDDYDSDNVECDQYKECDKVDYN